MSREEIFNIVKENIKEILLDIEIEKIGAADSLRAIGANSIDRADIIINTMSQLKIKVNLVEFGKLSNIGEIVDLFYEKVNG